MPQPGFIRVLDLSFIDLLRRLVTLKALRIIHTPTPPQTRPKSPRKRTVPTSGCSEAASCKANTTQERPTPQKGSMNSTMKKRPVLLVNAITFSVTNEMKPKL